MSNVDQLRAKRDAARNAALTGPLQAKHEALRPKLVAAKLAGRTAEVAALLIERAALQEERDAPVDPLNKQLKEAHREARKETIKAAAKGLSSMSDDSLAQAAAQMQIQATELRARLKAAAFELAEREARKTVKALVGKLGPAERAALENELERKA